MNLPKSVRRVLTLSRSWPSRRRRPRSASTTASMSATFSEVRSSPPPGRLAKPSEAPSSSADGLHDDIGGDAGDLVSAQRRGDVVEPAHRDGSEVQCAFVAPAAAVGGGIVGQAQGHQVPDLPVGVGAAAGPLVRVMQGTGEFEQMGVGVGVADLSRLEPFELSRWRKSLPDFGLRPTW